jgi:hypothetical protein
MKRPARIRRWFKSAGLVVSLFVAAIWVASLHWTVAYGWDHYLYTYKDEETKTILTANERWFIETGAGHIWFQTAGFWNGTLPYGLEFRETHESLVWLFRIEHQSIGNFVFILPLWIPFLLVAIPTGFLFWRDRRIPCGHCQKCGYNLTGNTSGVCPECGEQI